MSGWSHAEVWTIIVVLGIGTYLIRLSFLGLIGNRELPAWVLRHLRYTPVAVLPGIATPLVLASGDGGPDPARVAAAVVTFAAGYLTRNVVAAIAAGAVTLYGGLYLLA